MKVRFQKVTRVNDDVQGFLVQYYDETVKCISCHRIVGAASTWGCAICGPCDTGKTINHANLKAAFALDKYAHDGNVTKTEFFIDAKTALESFRDVDLHTYRIYSDIYKDSQ